MKIRVISAIIAILITVPFAYFGGYYFLIFSSILAVQAYNEILALKKAHNDYPMLIKILGMVSLLFLIVGNYGINSLYFSISYTKVLLPFLLIVLPVVFYDRKKYTTRDAFYLLGIIYFIGIFFNLLVTIRNYNGFLLLYLASVSIFTDTFAYLVGSLIGHHKMAPKISPKKSWEGAIGGVIGGSIIPLIIYLNLVGSFDIKILLVTILLTIVGQIGDLVYSEIKRENDIKDFSNIMPGHGGILDRIDSLTFVVYAYIFIIYFIM